MSKKLSIFDKIIIGFSLLKFSTVAILIRSMHSRWSNVILKFQENQIDSNSSERHVFAAENDEAYERMLRGAPAQRDS